MGARCVCGGIHSAWEGVHACFALGVHAAHRPPLMPTGGTGGGASVPWRKTPGKWCEYSITVSRASGDITPEEWEVVRKYFFDMFTHFFMAMERGDFEDQQHIQAVVQDGNRTFSGGQGVGAGLKRALGWGRGAGATAGGQVCIKCLTNSGLHTWHGMLGYCTKYEPIAKERDGELMSSRKGVTDDDIAQGKQLYLEWGRPNKRTIELTPKNLMGRMEVYALQSLRRVPRPNMWRVLATMLASRKYSLGGEWGKKWAALNSEALSIVWRQRTAMETLTIDQLMTVIVGQYVPRRIHSQDQGDPSPEDRFARIFERDDLYEEDEVVEAREQAMGAGGGPTQPSGLGSGYRSASGAGGAGGLSQTSGAGGHRSASDRGVSSAPSWSGTLGSGSTTASTASPRPAPPRPTFRPICVIKDEYVLRAPGGPVHRDM